MRCIEIEDLKVDLIRRTGGGWLAVAAPGSRFLIGVTGLTEEETKAKFIHRYRRWEEIADQANAGSVRRD